MDVCFQRLRPRRYPQVLYHLARGRRARGFDVDGCVRRRPWVRRLVDAGRLEAVYIRPYCAEHGEAIDEVERTGGGLSAVAKKCLLERVFEEVYLRRNAGPGA